MASTIGTLDAVDCGCATNTPSSVSSSGEPTPGGAVVGRLAGRPDWAVPGPTVAVN